MLDKKPRCRFVLGLLLGLSLGLAAAVGAVATLTWSSHPALVLPETALHASAAQSSDTLAVATGMVDDDMEGLFVLDFVTGELKCMVMNPRNMQINSLFTTSVLNDLGIDASRKRPDFLMVTGISRFMGQSNVSMSVVYVVDANTGIFGAYGMPWFTGMARAGRPQTGPLRLLYQGNARTALVRE
jgi:hypothetical protein